VGERIGQPLSRETVINPSADVVHLTEGKIGRREIASARRTFTPLLTPRLHRTRPVLHLLISPGCSSGARLRLMARFLGARCHCGQVAVSHRTIRSYRAAGRLTEREAGLLLPRADKPPVEPLCVHHMLSFLEQRLGKGIKSRFWDGRLSWPRNTSQCHRHPCHGTKSNGSACAALP
jgi:hypothetical protein